MREVIEYHQEIIEPTPKCIREVCEAAGKDGWELAGILAVMLPPTSKRRVVERTSGLLLNQAVHDEPISPALAVQMEAAQNQPTPAVLVMFKRLAYQDNGEK